MDVIIDPLLPVEYYREASNIETKQRVQIPTGEMTHGFKIGNTLRVSKEVFDILVENTEVPKGWQRTNNTKQ